MINRNSAATHHSTSTAATSDPNNTRSLLEPVPVDVYILLTYSRVTFNNRLRTCCSQLQSQATRVLGAVNCVCRGGRKRSLGPCQRDVVGCCCWRRRLMSLIVSQVSPSTSLLHSDTLPCARRCPWPNPHQQSCWLAAVARLTAAAPAALVFRICTT